MRVRLLRCFEIFRKLSIAIIHRKFIGHGALGTNISSSLARFLHLTEAVHKPQCEYTQCDEGEGEYYDPSEVLVTVDILLVVDLWKANAPIAPARTLPFVLDSVKPLKWYKGI